MPTPASDGGSIYTPEPSKFQAIECAFFKWFVILSLNYLPSSYSYASPIRAGKFASNFPYKYLELEALFKKFLLAFSSN